jgi:hypothetical protein
VSLGVSPGRLSGVTSSAPETLPLALLLRSALREVRDDDGLVSMPSMIALHRQPTREVFDRAAALISDTDAMRRELGVRILRELGGEQPDGRRPFSSETVTLLHDRLRDETDPAVTYWIVSALGYHGGRQALPDVVALAGHPDDRVRFHVAAALPGLVDLDHVEPEAAAALIRLCHDADADTRFYALYAVIREIPSMDVDAFTGLVTQLADDPDEQVRAMAVSHREAIREVRELLSGTHDHLIGPVLVALADTDADGSNDDLRRRLGSAAAGPDGADLTEKLLTWWAGRQGPITGA